MLADAVRLWTTVPPYSGFPCQTIAWRLLPAIENKKIRFSYRDGECVGFVTWAWLTNAEVESDDYSGVEVFGRNSSDHLVIMDMIAPNGRKDVYFMAKDIRSFLSDLYPDCEVGISRRKDRFGRYSRVC
tara:strand:+ start:2379 stop:2765 length:387 start_codon:yes stop_codon:yes gene_type:complete